LAHFFDLLLTTFRSICGRFLTSFWARLDPLAANFWPVSGQFLAGFWPGLGQFLASFWPVLGQFWTNFWIDFRDPPKITKIMYPPFISSENDGFRPCRIRLKAWFFTSIFATPPKGSLFDHFLATFWPVSGQLLDRFWPAFGQLWAASWPALDRLRASSQLPPGQLFSPPGRLFFDFEWISDHPSGRRFAGCWLKAVLSGFSFENDHFGAQISALRANANPTAVLTLFSTKPTHKPCRRCQKVTPRGHWASSVGFFFWSPSPFFTFLAIFRIF